MARWPKNIRGKCPNCCPDGGAIFDRDYDDAGERYGKRCLNCGLWLPTKKAADPNPVAPNATQQAWIDRLAAAFGGEHEVKMIGRKAWITLTNYDGRHYFDGQAAYGTIGPNGAIEITLQRPFVGDKVCRDARDIHNYLTTANGIKKTAATQS